MIFGDGIERLGQFQCRVKCMPQNDRECGGFRVHIAEGQLIECGIVHRPARDLFHSIRAKHRVIITELQQPVIALLRRGNADLVDDLAAVQQQILSVDCGNAACAVLRAPCKITAKLLIGEIIVHRYAARTRHMMGIIVGEIRHEAPLLHKQAFHRTCAACRDAGERAHLAQPVGKLHRKLCGSGQNGLLTVNLIAARYSSGRFPGCAAAFGLLRSPHGLRLIENCV